MTYLPGRLIDGSPCRRGAHGAVTLGTYHTVVPPTLDEATAGVLLQRCRRVFALGYLRPRS